MRVAGTVRAPGDKSITHRALLFGAFTRGVSHVGGALTSLDARSSARVLRQLGAEISPLRQGDIVRIRGRGRFRTPDTALNCGNSGTTTRLRLGMLAGHRFRARLTGDASLRLALQKGYESSEPAGRFRNSVGTKQSDKAAAG